MKRPIISAPLNIVTGTMGAGKTLFAIQQADLLRKFTGAVVYQLGINQPDLRKLPVLPFPLEEWAVRADAGELKNAVVIVDEFHKWMPQRGNGRPPKWIEEFAEARRRGIIFILLTQSSEFDHFLKGTRLNKHFFLSRKGFLNRSTIYEWSERFVHDPVANKDARKEAVLTNWWHPKAYYDWYVSAVEHRFKVRLPLRVWAALVFIPVFAFVAWRGVTTVRSLTEGELSTLGVSSEAPVLSDSALGSGDPMPVAREGGGSVIHPTKDIVRYLEQFEPLTAHMPWSAPVFQGREVVARPDIFCIARGEGGSDGCNCYTEQATRLPQVLPEVCQSIARHGLYNPYRSSAVVPASSPTVEPVAGPSGDAEVGLAGSVIDASSPTAFLEGLQSSSGP